MNFNKNNHQSTYGRNHNNLFSRKDSNNNSEQSVASLLKSMSRPHGDALFGRFRVYQRKSR